MSAAHDHDPVFRAPPGSCDTHFHGFGPHERYPFATRARYEPPTALLPEYLSLCDRLGVERMVFVQPSAYGQDNRCMLDAMAQVEPGRRRGIVDIDEHAPDAEIERLHARGVRGVRINTSPYAPPDPERAGVLTPRIETLASRLAGSGWCLEFLSPGWLNVALMPVLRRLEIDFVVCHIGLFQAAEGTAQAGFQQFLELARQPNCWIKLTGIYRISQAPGFTDVTPMVQAVAEVAPDRLIWGSDHPHISFDHAGSIELFNLLAEWFPRDEDRHRVLALNPARLFGFDP